MLQVSSITCICSSIHFYGALIVALKIFSKFTGIHLCQSLFLINLMAEAVRDFDAMFRTPGRLPQYLVDLVTFRIFRVIPLPHGRS